jgi:hypothetical protein
MSKYHAPKGEGMLPGDIVCGILQKKTGEIGLFKGACYKQSHGWLQV